MKILVTGAEGMLGQDLCPIFEDEDYEVVETNKNTLDVTNEIQVNNIIKKENPDILIHCAAYTNVDEAEKNSDTAALINVKGTENIAKACAKNDIIMVYISTDYVFDGENNSPYMPNDKPNPINNYGLTKFQGEQMIQKYCEKYYIVRTSWLFGHHGKNFIETMLSLSDKPEIKVVDDQFGCPTWTVDLSDGILNLLQNEEEFGIYHICGKTPTTWYDFAKEIFMQAGKNVNLIPCKTKDFPRPANRPKYSVMNSENFKINWKKSLKEYLELRIEE